MHRQLLYVIRCAFKTSACRWNQQTRWDHITMNSLCAKPEGVGCLRNQQSANAYVGRAPQHNCTVFSEPKQSVDRLHNTINDDKYADVEPTVHSHTTSAAEQEHKSCSTTHDPAATLLLLLCQRAQCQPFTAQHRHGLQVHKAC
jgi:hypothetical protein